MSPLRASIVALALLSASRAATAGEGAPCLGPGVGRALGALAEAHAFAALVPAGYRLERLDVASDHIEMGYDDDAGPAVTVTLRRPGPGPVPDAQGPHFAHSVADARGHLDPPARAAMLRAAMLADRAVPDEELLCRGNSRRTPTEVRAPGAFGLGMGAVQVAVVVAAVALGVRRRRR